MNMTYKQCRAARSLLGITQDQLASDSGVSLRAISNFEKQKSSPIPANLSALEFALKKKGVVFISKNEDSPSGGTGVRLKK